MDDLTIFSKGDVNFQLRISVNYQKRRWICPISSCFSSPFPRSSFSETMLAMKQLSVILRSRKRQQSMTFVQSSAFPKVPQRIFKSLLQQLSVIFREYFSPSFRASLLTICWIQLFSLKSSDVTKSNSWNILVLSSKIYPLRIKGVMDFFWGASMVCFPRKMLKMLMSYSSQTLQVPFSTTASMRVSIAFWNSCLAAVTPSEISQLISSNFRQKSLFLAWSPYLKMLRAQQLCSLSFMNSELLLQISCMILLILWQGAQCLPSPLGPSLQGGLSITKMFLLVMLPQQLDIPGILECMTVSLKQAAAGPVLIAASLTRLMMIFTQLLQLGNMTWKLCSICTYLSGITKRPFLCCSVTTIRKRTYFRLAAMVRMQWKLMSQRKREESAWPGISTIAHWLCPFLLAQKLGFSVTDCCVLRTMLMSNLSLGLRQVSAPSSQTTFMGSPDMASASVDLPARVLPMKITPLSSRGRPQASWKRQTKSSQLQGFRSEMLLSDIGYRTYNQQQSGSIMIGIGQEHGNG